ncbi:HNH endonuclease signature motif containing protein [Mycobacterium canetti]|uniref:HNH endonuclease signature motif containing protein n=1 Tax=Mycobacterium canetti TaxID=78331 RepID=UPI001E2BDD41|nr:HNH endonuclease signature motif containing protein [Mycobacterium canetti]
MLANSREELVEVFDALDAELDRLCEVSFEVLSTPERLRSLERLECLARRLPAVGHTLINQLDAQASEEELGGTLCCALANRLRITKPEAGRRIAEAKALGQRRALTGEPLAPQLTATAAAQRQGLIGDGHVKVIRAFVAHLPAEVDVSTREAAEADLAGKAAQYRPDELARYAQRVMDWLHPDGDFTDTERARKRGITLSNQQYDGMSRLSGYLTPEARATFEAVLAKLAAPGATNPDDHTPLIDATPDAAAIGRDTRSQAQRNHDGLLAGLRGLLASGKLGQHNGLPVSIVVTTTLTDLQAGAGKGFTGGGTLLPMADVIRMASHAHHYLAIFDHGKPLALYHTKRLASPAQRIMLFAKDRGCTKPGCDAPAYHSQAHHVTGWTSTGRTDITDLTLACGPDNRLAEKGWTTRKNTHGDTEWLPPPHLDHGQPRTNTFHHPEKLLRHNDEDNDDDP